MRNMLPIVTVKQIARRFGEVSDFVASEVKSGQRHRETVFAERKRVGAGIKHNASFHASVADFVREPVHVAEVVDTRKGACLDFDSNEIPVAAFEDKVDFPPGM